MTLYVCVLGIDGSGKSTLAASLPIILAAEMNLVAGSAGEAFRISGPDEDHLAPKFHPEGFPISARLSRWSKRVAKRVVDRRSLYPFFKLAQMVFQDSATRKLARRYGTGVMVSDGNVLLSTAGRAANYRRPASDHAGESQLAPDAEDLAAAFAYVLDGKPLLPESESRLPPLGRARAIYRLCRLLGLDGIWLPDVVLFLDLSPKLAVARIASRRQKVDRHENEADLAQARGMYLKTLDAFRRHRGGGAAHCIPVDRLSPGETLRAALEVLRPRLLAQQAESPAPKAPLGTTTTRLTGSAVWGKVWNYRYVVRYLLAKWFSGAWREPMFAFSSLGRLFLQEGYSAGVMRVIYDQDEKRYGLLDRIFLGYPLHRAVYDRLRILTKKIEPELEARLKKHRETPGQQNASDRTVRIFTAPSGFAYDLFRPLEAITSCAPELMQNLDLVAADLDPHGVLAEELTRRAAKLDIRFRFLRGDMTSEEMRARFEEMAPYDLVLFVGLSSWLPRPQTVRHLQWLREHLRADGLLVSDCFTPEAYALSGRYVGYKAQYYTPENYRALLDYCGLDGLPAAVESGRDAINHVVVARPRPLPAQTETLAR